MRELLWLMRARFAASRQGAAIALPPRLDSLSPSVGSTAGGTTVTLNGNNLVPPYSVTFGGASAASVTRVSDQQVQAVTPPGSAGIVDVAITTLGGISTLLSSFTYSTGVDAILLETGDTLITEASDRLVLE